MVTKNQEEARQLREKMTYFDGSPKEMEIPNKIKGSEHKHKTVLHSSPPSTLPKEIQEAIEHFETQGIVLGPAGLWKLGSTTLKAQPTKPQPPRPKHWIEPSSAVEPEIESASTITATELYPRKEPIDAFRTTVLTMSEARLMWNKHPKDNMAKHTLNRSQNIMVVDIDGAELRPNRKGPYTSTTSFLLPALGITLPPTMFTTTSAPNKFHFYYRVTSEDMKKLPSRVVGLKPKVDIFTHGTVFDLHFYSPHSSLVKNDLAKAPVEMMALLFEALAEKGVKPPDPSSAKTSNKLVPLANPEMAYKVKQFLRLKTFGSEREQNSFMKMLFPSNQIKKGLRKIAFSDFQLNYTTINSIAVKLTTTSELGFIEHTLPMLNLVIKLLGGNPNSDYSKGILHKQILPSLPQHSPIIAICPNKDLRDFEELVAEQPNTKTPVFAVIENGTIKYMQVSRTSYEPIEHSDGYFFDLSTAKRLNRERITYNNDGKPSGWDDNIPLVYYTDDPRKEAFFYDIDDRIVFNLYRRTDYYKRATPSPTFDESNIIYKLLHSSVDSEYRDLVMRYHAALVFDDRAPIMVLWMASLKTDKGGTGKSIITVDLVSRLLGSAAPVISASTLNSDWGDVMIGARALSLEDLPVLSSREFNDLYAKIKQSTSASEKKLNMKGKSFKTQRIDISITGSSNERLSLHPSDRRFLCLEPAHLREHSTNKALTNKEAIRLEDFRTSRKYEPELQEYANYLLYLAQKPLTPEMKTHLYIAPPETRYRAKWVEKAQTNTANLIDWIRKPQSLVDALRINDMNIEHIIELLSLVPKSFNPATSKFALPWNWFQEILPYIQSEKYEEVKYSKLAVAQMLGIDFTTNVGRLYTEEWDSKWKSSGYIVQSSEQTMEDYREQLVILNKEYVEPQERQHNTKPNIEAKD